MNACSVVRSSRPAGLFSLASSTDCQYASVGLRSRSSRDGIYEQSWLVRRKRVRSIGGCGMTTAS